MGAVGGHAAVPVAVHCSAVPTHRLSGQRKGLLGGQSQSEKFGAHLLFQHVVWPAGHDAHDVVLTAQRPEGHRTGEEVGHGHSPKLPMQEPSQHRTRGGAQSREQSSRMLTHLPALGVDAGQRVGLEVGHGQFPNEVAHEPSQHTALAVAGHEAVHSVAVATHALGRCESAAHLTGSELGQLHWSMEGTHALSQQRIWPVGHELAEHCEIAPTHWPVGHLTGELGGQGQSPKLALHEPSGHRRDPAGHVPHCVAVFVTHM